MKAYKPEDYNSLSPYLIVDNAQQLVDLLTVIFDAKTLRRYDQKNGKIMHIELLLDDTVVMISDSTENYGANKTMLHIYVPDVFETYTKALKQGCMAIEPPANRGGDPDTRGSFYDFAGNHWSVSTQNIREQQQNPI